MAKLPDWIQVKSTSPDGVQLQVLPDTRPPFTEYRKDGWPLCPQCGEDELMSRAGVDIPQTVEAYVAAGMVCLVCGWSL